MALFYAEERYQLAERNKHNAAAKARSDINAILEREGLQKRLVIQSISEGGSFSFAKKALRRLSSLQDWKKGLNGITCDDILFVQFPNVNHSVPVSRYLATLAGGGVRIILVVHDMESFRLANDKSVGSLRAKEHIIEEKQLVEACTALIVHNDAMVQLVGSLFGASAAKKSISLNCFDYLFTESDGQARAIQNKDDKVVVAGNLAKRKAGYVYQLPQEVPFKLYGSNYEANPPDNVQLCGSFPPNELPRHLSGSFGLVWDGPSAATCEGAYGEYLRYNNPHKTSLYLACGLPVIIWDQAALAPFVIDNGVGLTLSNLNELQTVIEAVSDDQYSVMLENASQLSSALREGSFFRSAFLQAIDYVNSAVKLDTMPSNYA